MLYNSILETIGSTPLIKIQSMTSHLPCNFYAKCEFFNPGGSIKDRIAFNMIRQAEKRGQIKKGDTLIEPSSGNTGLGLALAGSVLGYKVIVVMPQKMSQEKEVVLKALGAKIYRTPTEVPSHHEDSHLSLARRLVKEIPGAFMLDQYNNPDNEDTHYRLTAQEILDDLKGRVDMLVVGAGTGGTVSGLSRRFKKECPQCRIIGVDPEGSILAEGEGDTYPYELEGIGYDFIPSVLNRKAVHQWVKVNDRDSFSLALRLIREEGLLCGGSSGAVMWAALQVAGQLKKGQNCVMIFSDGVRNYLGKFLNPQWLKTRLKPE